MLNTMTLAKNAIEAYNAALQVTAANIANMDVTGYKHLDVSFQSIFESILSRGTAAYGDSGGTNPRQLGQGMALSSITIDMSQGSTAASSNIHLAISGQGFFIVSPDGGSTYLYTRAGNFTVNASGYLTVNGMVVYGLDSSGNLAPISGLTSGNDANYSWGTDGTLYYSGSSTGYRIALTYFPNPQGLVQAQGTSFRETVASGSPYPAAAPGGTAGSVTPGSLEASNVSYYTESLLAAEYNRALSANLSVVQMASELISNFINKLS